MKNRPTIEDILNNPKAGEGLPLDVCVDLMEEAKTRAKAIAAVGKLIEADVAGRYTDQIAAAYRNEHKDTGTVHVFDGAYDIAADRPKKVEWDGAKLAEIADRIRTAGEDPAEYLDVSYCVPERKYTAWPTGIRETFEDARTVKPGTLSIKIALREAA